MQHYVMIGIAITGIEPNNSIVQKELEKRGLVNKLSGNPYVIKNVFDGHIYVGAIIYSGDNQETADSIRLSDFKKDLEEIKEDMPDARIMRFFTAPEKRHRELFD